MERENENLSLTIDGFLRGTLREYWQGSGGVFTAMVFCEEAAQGKQYAPLTHLQLPARRHSVPPRDGRDPFFWLLYLSSMLLICLLFLPLCLLSPLCSLPKLCLFVCFRLFPFLILCARP